MAAQCLSKGCQNPPGRSGYCSPHAKRRMAAVAKMRADEIAAEARAVHNSEFLYVIGIQGNQAFKVGRSLDPVKRMANLQCAIPLNLVLEAAFCVASSSAVQLERAAHQALAEDSLRGEWFKADLAKIVETINRCAAEIQAPIIDPVAALIMCREDKIRTGGSDDMHRFESKCRRLADLMGIA